MGAIYLVRHGQAAFGTDDYDRLTEIGYTQAHLLGGPKVDDFTIERDPDTGRDVEL